LAGGGGMYPQGIELRRILCTDCTFEKDLFDFL
jgi:hypothetical protein